jgi:hypothetical protein
MTVPSPEFVQYTFVAFTAIPQGLLTPVASVAAWHALDWQAAPWQSWPHAPQLCVSLVVSTQAPLHMVSRQAQVPVLQSGVGCAHVGWFSQIPVASQTWGVDIEHCTAPGAHKPVQLPMPEHRNWQVCVVCQAPVVSQVWTEVPEHCVSPGTQLPLHAPPAHPKGQGCAFRQAPVPSQVCTPLPAHCLAPGVQAPAQMPSPVQR